jgi:hypothetical protein
MKRKNKMKVLIIYILVLSSCVLLDKNRTQSINESKGELIRYKYLKYESIQFSGNSAERIDTIQIFRKYLTDNYFVQTGFQPYFPKKTGLLEGDTVFNDTFLQNGEVWYHIENQKHVLYFNKDSMNLGEYGTPYSQSSTFFLKDKYLDTISIKGEFVVKLRSDIFSLSKFNGNMAFEKGQNFCFSPLYGWVIGHPYYKEPDVYILVEIQSVTHNEPKISVFFQGLDSWIN